MAKPNPRIEQMMQQAVQLHQSGRVAEAEGLYRQVLLATPNQPDALHLLGVALSQQGRHEAAVEYLGRAVALHPKNADFQSNLGATLASLGRTTEAIDAFSRAVSLRAAYFDAWQNLGVALKTAARLDESISAFRRAVALQPKNPAALQNLGDALRVAAQLPEAQDVFQRELAIDPNNAEAHNLLAVTLLSMGKSQEGIDTLRKAISLRPNYGDAYNNLANELQARGRMQEAIDTYEKAIASRPNFPAAYSNLANLLRDCDRPDDAIAAYRTAMRQEPGFVVAHDNYLLALFAMADLTAADIFREHLQWEAQHAKPLAGEIRPHANNRSPDRRLRIGYVSPDFQHHSVAYFLEGLLAAHDPSAVELFCYADLQKTDAMTLRLQKHAHHWRMLAGLSDARVAELVREDAIDILVDLAGHTADNRLLVFARKPAPVQVTYLGYPGTTGLHVIDYRFTDPLADPVGSSDEFYTEKLFRLPRTFLAFTPTLEIAPQLPAAARGSITFGSFNHSAKITAATVQLWARVLQAVPDSRLLIKCQGLTDPPIRQRMLDRFAAHAISADRLELLGKTDLMADHLALYNRIDIALDPIPYHGTTTTCESTWMGVPVISLAGSMHAGRVGVSLLTNLGLQQLIAQTPDQYVQIAADLAGNIAQLTEYRTTLRRRMTESPIMDAPALARDIESAYRRMWHRWLAAGAA